MIHNGNISSRLEGAASGIDLERLQRRRDLRVLPWCAVAATLLLIGVLYLLVPREKEEAPKPLSTKFIKRRPMSRRPLVLRKRPQPMVRPLKREKLVSEVPRAVVDRAGVSGLVGGLKVLESVVAHPKMEIVRRVPFRKVQVGPTIQVGEIRIARHAKDHVDLSLEMMDVESLDTGRYRGLVVIDPTDKRKVKGFLHLASVYAESIEEMPYFWTPPEFVDNRRATNTRALKSLAEEMNEDTRIRADVLESIPLDSETLLEIPFVLITANQAFKLTDAEARNLGRYLVSGGFAYVELLGSPMMFYTKQDLPALREMVVDALRTQGLEKGRDWEFQQLPQRHFVYHCYFDFDSLPPSYYDVIMRSFLYPPQEYVGSPDYLEGVYVNGRLVLVYSQKGYRDFWAGRMDEIRQRMGGEQSQFKAGERQLQLGINILVFALTQEGGLARRLVACADE